jgi:hypothetical protein
MQNVRRRSAMKSQVNPHFCWWGSWPGHLAKVRVAGSNPVVRSRESPGRGGARGFNCPLRNASDRAMYHIRTTFFPVFSVSGR